MTADNNCSAYKNLTPSLEGIRRESREWLSRAGEAIDPSLDSPFQLMLWGLDHGLTMSNRGYLYQLRENVEYLAYQVENRDMALEFVVREADSSPEEFILTPKQLSHAENALQASSLLVTALDMAMSADPNVEG